MSSGGDSSSDASSVCSSVSTVSALATSTTSPTLEETLFQPQLFYAFLRFLLHHKAHENLVFMKHASLFPLLRRPPRETYLAASRIIWTYLCESSPSPVNLSAETLRGLTAVVWRKDGAALVKRTMFAEAYAEVQRMVEPLFAQWIASGEWVSLPFFHTPPPTVAVVLRIPSLRARFEAFLKAREDQPAPLCDAARLDSRIYRFTAELSDIVAAAAKPGTSKKDAERSARHYIRAHRAELAALPGMDEVELPAPFRHKKSKTRVADAEETSADAGAGAGAGSASGSAAALPSATGEGEERGKGDVTCLGYVTEAVDVLTEELTERDSFESFLESKSWDPLEVLGASLQQSHDKDGYTEYPTLAAILLSPTYGPLIIGNYKGSEKYDQLHFLIQAHEFYAHHNLSRKLRSSERREMVAEARAIYSAYVSKNQIGLPKTLKNEVAVLVHSSVPGKVTPLLFQRAGAWLYNVIARSWIRETTALLLWVDHDFDNHAPAVVEMEQLFDIAHIPGVDLKLVPHPDDVVANPDLWASFTKFVPQSEFHTRCLEFVRAVAAVTSGDSTAGTTSAGAAAAVGSLMDQLKAIVKDVPDLAPMQAEIEEHMRDLSTFNPAAFGMPRRLVLRILLEQHYAAWTAKCKSAYRKGTWTPVAVPTFVGNDAITGTSTLQATGVTTLVSGKMPSPGGSGSGSGSGKDRKRWGLGVLARVKADLAGSGAGSSSGSSSNDVGVSPRAPPFRTPAGSGSSGGNGGVYGVPPRVLSPMASPVVGRLPQCPPVECVGAKTRRDSYEDVMLSPGGNAPLSPGGMQLTLPSTVAKSVPTIALEVPTLQETLCSTHLRRLFFATFLDLRLGDDEKAVWAALCRFHASFVCLTDAEVASRQGDIRAAAQKVLDEVGDRLPEHDTLAQCVADPRFVLTARFFCNAECKLYTQFHNSYQSFLLTNHWVMH